MARSSKIRDEFATPTKPSATTAASKAAASGSSLKRFLKRSFSRKSMSLNKESGTVTVGGVPSAPPSTPVGKSKDDGFAMPTATPKASTSKKSKFATWGKKFRESAKDLMSGLKTPTSSATPTVSSGRGSVRAKRMSVKNALFSPEREARPTVPLARVAAFFTVLKRAVLKRGALNHDGIFRVSGRASQANALVDLAADAKKPLPSVDDLLAYDVDTLSSTIKQLLRQCDETVLPNALIDGNWHEGASLLDTNGVAAELYTLPQVHRDLLEELFCLLYAIAMCSDVNRMHTSNLGLVFAPTLCREEASDDRRTRAILPSESSSYLRATHKQANAIAKLINDAAKVWPRAAQQIHDADIFIFAGPGGGSPLRPALSPMLRARRSSANYSGGEAGSGGGSPKQLDVASLRRKLIVNKTKTASPAATAAAAASPLKSRNCVVVRNTLATGAEKAAAVATPSPNRKRKRLIAEWDADENDENSPTPTTKRGRRTPSTRTLLSTPVAM